MLSNHMQLESPIIAPKAAAPAMAAVVKIRSFSENHTWLTWRGNLDKALDSEYKPRKWARVTEQGYSEMRSFQALEATLVDIVMRNGWPIAITAWPAKVNQNLKREIKQKSVRLTGGNDSGVVDDDADLVTGFRWSVSPGIVEKRRVRPPTNIHEEPQRTPAWWRW